MSKSTEQTQVKHDDRRPLVCGLVMPISACDSMPAEHWAEVRGVVSAACRDAGFAASLVSDALDSGVIQKRIVQNLYENDLVVCDVSGRNANVMFELGMRLAFDKPTILIKDDRTPSSFDTANIEYLEYPRDLRYARMIAFGERLTNKLASARELLESGSNPNSFLRTFGPFETAQLESKSVPAEQFVLEQMERLTAAVDELRAEVRRTDRTPSLFSYEPRPTSSTAGGEVQRALDAAMMRAESVHQRATRTNIGDIIRFLAASSSPQTYESVEHRFAPHRPGDESLSALLETLLDSGLIEELKDDAGVRRLRLSKLGRRLFL